MLLTLKHEANRAGFIMPAPQRLGKVRERHVVATYRHSLSRVLC